MTATTEVALTTFLTIVSGVSIFVIGQFILRLVLDPIVEFKEILGSISYLFLSHQAKITNATGDLSLQHEIKRHSSSLLSKKEAIPFYKFYSFWCWLPKEYNVSNASRSINLVAHFVVKNSVDEQLGTNRPVEIHEQMKKIQDYLGIRVNYTEG